MVVGVEWSGAAETADTPRLASTDGGEREKLSSATYDPVVEGILVYRRWVGTEASETSSPSRSLMAVSDTRGLCGTIFPLVAEGDLLVCFRFEGVVVAGWSWTFSLPPLAAAAAAIGGLKDSTNGEAVLARRGGGSMSDREPVVGDADASFCGDCLTDGWERRSEAR